MQQLIDIAKDYTKTPGGRYVKDGPYSGEDFRETILKPVYLDTQNRGEQLQVVLDGGYGYGSSFLEEAFGGLVREIKDPNVSKIEIISEEEPQLVIDVKKYIHDAIKKLGE